MARHAQPKIDNAILEMAIVGYQNELTRISARMTEIRAQLGKNGRSGRKAAAAGHLGTRPRMSAAGRARIAAAQRARWAAYKKAKGQPAKGHPARTKRRLSAAGRRAIVAATKKRWAKFRKARKTAA